VGERVWVYNGQWGRPFGTAADYITLPATQAISLPGHVSFAEGACLGIPAMTAHRCLFADGSIRGQTVLVTGGAGAVGYYAIQLAKWGGARVITTVSFEAKAETARQAGADFTLNYRTENIVERIQTVTEGAGVDRIVEVDFGGNLPFSREVIKENGIIAAYASMGAPEPSLPFYALMFKNITLRAVLVYSMPEAAKAQACVDIVQALREQQLHNLIAARFPLERLAEAHEAQESGQYVGNIIIDIV
jgi:NADPH2:quinone reductase